MPRGKTFQDILEDSANLINLMGKMLKFILCFPPHKLYGTSSPHCQWQLLTAPLRGDKNRLSAVPRSKGVSCSTRGGAGGIALCVEKLFQNWRIFCEEWVNSVKSSKRLHHVRAAKAMIQWLTSNSLKARPRNGGLQSLGLHTEWSQQSFCSWGGDSVTEV